MEKSNTVTVTLIRRGLPASSVSSDPLRLNKPGQKYVLLSSWSQGRCFCTPSPRVSQCLERPWGDLALHLGDMIPHTFIGASDTPQNVYNTVWQRLQQRFSDPRHTTVLTQCIYSKCSCTCSSYRHFLLVFHQEVLHYLSRLQVIQTRCLHQNVKNNTVDFCLCVCVVVTFWSTCAGVTFSSPLWTCDVLGWVNVVSSSSSWVRIIHRKTFLCEHNESHI